MNYVTTRTPHRISILGGGTDIKEFYEIHQGAVLSFAIDKYVYVTVKKHPRFFNEKYRIVYSETELRQNRLKIKNDIVRSVLEFLEFEEPLYISSISDVPAGSGLGSSSAFTVGLLHAIHIMKGNKQVSKSQLAEEACHIEISMLKNPIGKQDQYACALGGTNFLKFNTNGSVDITKSTYIDNITAKLAENSFLVWTGISRSSSIVLKSQRSEITSGKIKDPMIKLRDICLNYSDYVNDLSSEKSIEGGHQLLLDLLQDSWNIKKNLNPKIENKKIRDLINKIRAQVKNKKFSLKLCGAGGGGFILCAFGKLQSLPTDLLTMRTNIDINQNGTELINKLEN